MGRCFYLSTHWLAKSDCLYPSIDSRNQSCKWFSMTLSDSAFLLHLLDLQLKCIKGNGTVPERKRERSSPVGQKHYIWEDLAWLQQQMDFPSNKHKVLCLSTSSSCCHPLGPLTKPPMALYWSQPCKRKKPSYMQFLKKPDKFTCTFNNAKFIFWTINHGFVQSKHYWFNVMNYDFKKMANKYKNWVFL